MLWFPNPYDSLWTWQSIPGKPFGIVSNLRSHCIYIMISRETDQYFRGLIEYLSSEYKRKEASGEKHNSDFASLMMANEISEEKAERKVSKLYYTNSFGLTNATPRLFKRLLHSLWIITVSSKVEFENVESASKGFTHEEILANAMLLILAGHETTAATLQFFWYLICMNPAVQNQIYEEIQQKEKFSYEDIRDFKVKSWGFSIQFKIGIFSIWTLV